MNGQTRRAVECGHRPQSNAGGGNPLARPRRLRSKNGFADRIVNVVDILNPDTWHAYTEAARWRAHSFGRFSAAGEMLGDQAERLFRFCDDLNFGPALVFLSFAPESDDKPPESRVSMWAFAGSTAVKTDLAVSDYEKAEYVIFPRLETAAFKLQTRNLDRGNGNWRSDAEIRLTIDIRDRSPEELIATGMNCENMVMVIRQLLNTESLGPVSSQ